MSRLDELVRNGVRVVGADESSLERDIPAEDLAPRASRQPLSFGTPADVTDFAPVYNEAGIAPPGHGYGVDKVADMLENSRLAVLGQEARAAAVLAALEAADVPIHDVIEDALRRDRALEAFREAKRRELEELKARNEARTRAIKEEFETMLRERNTEMASLKQTIEDAVASFAELQTRKRKEEERLQEVTSHLVEGPGGSLPAPGGKAR